ncbi:MAG TPA: SufD family Fe-S cluster assembly protein [Clostridia bacterium]|nr:SufD family Fe-S cluster assembly protein [Clostridia bacterium]
MKFTRLNELPMPTWHWLNMNAAELETDAALSTPYRGGALSVDEAKIKIEHRAELKTIEHLPKDMDSLREFVYKNQNYALTVTIPAGLKCDGPVMLDFVLDEASPVLLDFLHVKAEAGSRADVVVRYRSLGGGSYFHGGFAFLEAEPKSKVRLIKIQTLGERDAHLDATAVSVGAGGEGNVLLNELGGAQAVSGCNISLAGKESRGELDSLYLGSGARKQDFNYRMEFRGKASEGKIAVRGALSGAARKALKVTLDFVRGASGAKGREEETVLTLSDRAVNLSTPLLLCGEADVEGAHATSSGRPDPNKLYYLMSRGLTERDAKRLLVEASFTPILNKLPAQELRGAVYERIREVVHHDGL